MSKIIRHARMKLYEKTMHRIDGILNGIDLLIKMNQK